MKLRVLSSFPALALCMFLAVAAPARAADLAPLLPAPGAATAPAPLPDLSGTETPGETTINPNEILLKNLRQISFEIFMPLPPLSPDVARPPAPSVVPGVVHSVNNTVQALAPALATAGSELHLAVAAALQDSFTWGELDRLLAAATNTARAHGWSLARAYAPEQELTGGVLRIEVIPVWMDQVAVEGAGWSDPERLRRPYLDRTGKVLRLPDMADAHAVQNMHPFRQVTPSLTPGRTEGSTTYRLHVREQRPWRVYGGFETTNSRHSGVGRYTAGFTSVAPWRTDDILTVQYSKDSRFDHLDSVSAVYKHALPWEHFFSVTFLWSESDTESDRYFEQESEDLLLRLNYTIPLPEAFGWTHALDLGWEWRRSHATNAFSGMTFFDNTYVSAPVFLHWNGNRWDQWGRTILSLEARAGLGGYLDHMGKANYNANRARADREWITLSPELRRDWRLPGDVIATQRLWAQWSPDRLADAGQFYLGGNRNIRGYRESEVSGDKGLGLSFELLSPSLLHLAAGKAGQAEPKAGQNGQDAPESDHNSLTLPDLRLVGFWDWGEIRRNGPLESYERSSTTMNGAGLGLRLQWADWAYVQVDYAWRLHDTGYRKDDRNDGFWHASVNISF